jgi:hypothetical protein
MQGDGAVRVEDALGPAGGAARVAHGGGGVLGEIPIGEVRLARIGEELLVVDRAVGRGTRADCDDVLEAAAPDELLGERPERLVHEEHAVAAVCRDVRVVVGVETEIQRVGDEPADGRAHVRLQVLRMVPHEGPDAVTVLETEPAERHDELLRAQDEVGVRVGVPALVRQAARDLVLAVQLVGTPQDRGYVELVVHHQPLHH